MKFLVLVFVVGCASSFSTPSIPAQQKGWVITTVTYNGSCIYSPFVKTGVADDDDEGRAQISGYGENGPQKVLEERFVLLGQAKTIGPAVCHAPAAW